jgi:hypothetical protein
MVTSQQDEESLLKQIKKIQQDVKVRISPYSF